MERELIAQVMACDNVQTKAAAKLGINRNTLHKKLKEYGLERGTSPPAARRWPLTCHHLPSHLSIKNVSVVSGISITCFAASYLVAWLLD